MQVLNRVLNMSAYSSFFPCVIGEWNKLNPEIRSSGSYNRFWKSLLHFIRPGTNKVYNINDIISIKGYLRYKAIFWHKVALDV